MKFEFEKKLIQLNKTHDDQIRAKETEFQKNMDLFEEEFKKVLLEQNQKHKDLQMAFKEKERTEGDIKNLFKVTIAKNNEQEDLIQELTETLELAKEQYDKNMDRVTAQYNALKSSLLDAEKSLKHLQFDNEKLNSQKRGYDEILKEQGDDASLRSKEILKMKRANADLKMEIAELKPKLEKALEKIKSNELKKEDEIEQIEQQMDNLNELINSKNIMLEDKNEEIGELKGKVREKEEEFEGFMKANNIKNM